MAVEGAAQSAGMRAPGPLNDLASELPGPASTLAHDELLLAVRAAVEQLPHDIMNIYYVCRG